MSSDDQDFFSGGGAEDTDTPIILGGPPMEDQFVISPEEPQYLGDVEEPAMDDPVLVEAGSGEEIIESSTGPSPMQQWNEEWQTTLLARKEEENARKAELLEKAQTDLEVFAAEREAKRQAKMAKNREDEQVKLEAIEADLENDNSWQRVSKMVELSHDSSKQAADVKRMRDILIFLKNEPAKAEALGA